MASGEPARAQATASQTSPGRPAVGVPSLVAIAASVHRLEEPAAVLIGTVPGVPRYGLPAGHYYALSPNLVRSAALDSSRAAASGSTRTLTQTLIVPVRRVTQSADLAVALRGRHSIEAGRTMILELKVTNRGPDLATAVQVSVDLPAGASVVSTSKNATAARQAVWWTIPSLRPHHHETFRIRIRLGSPGEAHFEARVTSATPDPVMSNNTATLRVQVRPHDRRREAERERRKDR